MQEQGPGVDRPARGRPRNLERREALLAAAREHLSEGSVRTLSIEALSRATGIGKPTIYRWWPTKNAVALDAVFAELEQALRFPEKPANVLDALRAQAATAATLLGSRVGRQLRELVGEAQTDERTLEAVRERFLNIRIQDACKLIAYGQEVGQVRVDVAPRDAVDLMYGPLYFRLLFGHGPVDPEAAHEFVRIAFAGLTPTI